jgi:hypothetical protein
MSVLGSHHADDLPLQVKLLGVLLFKIDGTFLDQKWYSPDPYNITLRDNKSLITNKTK